MSTKDRPDIVRAAGGTLEDRGLGPHHEGVVEQEDLVRGLAKGQDRTIKRLAPRHHRILDMHLDGMKATEIARALGMSSGAVNLVIRSPVYQSELSRRREERSRHLDQEYALELDTMRREMASHATSAIRVQGELLEDTDPRVRQEAVKQTLGRVWGEAGVDGKGGKGSGGAPVVLIDAAGVENLNLAFSESLKEDGA